VEDVEDSRPGRHVFRIKTKTQMLAILAASQREKKQWLDSLKEFIRDPIEMGGDGETPTWQSDSEVTRCQACDKPFQILLRRHHCRRCGRIFCAICTSARVYLPGVASLAHEPQRVCGGCAKALSRREKEYRTEILDALFTRARAQSCTSSINGRIKIPVPRGIKLLKIPDENSDPIIYDSDTPTSLNSTPGSSYRSSFPLKSMSGPVSEFSPLARLQSKSFNMESDTKSRSKSYKHIRNNFYAVGPRLRSESTGYAATIDEQKFLEALRIVHHEKVAMSAANSEPEMEERVSDVNRDSQPEKQKICSNVSVKFGNEAENFSSKECKNGLSETGNNLTKDGDKIAMSRRFCTQCGSERRSRKDIFCSKCGGRRFFCASPTKMSRNTKNDN